MPSHFHTPQARLYYSEPWRWTNRSPSSCRTMCAWRAAEPGCECPPAQDSRMPSPCGPHPPLPAGEGQLLSPFPTFVSSTGERLYHKPWLRQENKLGFSKLTFSVAFDDQGLRLLNLEFQKHAPAKNSSCCRLPIHRATAAAASGPTATRAAAVSKVQVLLRSDPSDLLPQPALGAQRHLYKECTWQIYIHIYVYVFIREAVTFALCW